MIDHACLRNILGRARFIHDERLTEIDNSQLLTSRGPRKASYALTFISGMTFP